MSLNSPDLTLILKQFKLRLITEFGSSFQSAIISDKTVVLHWTKCILNGVQESAPTPKLHTVHYWHVMIERN